MNKNKKKKKEDVLNDIYITGLPYFTYIYIIGHYNPSVRIIDQFLTPLMLCVLILYISGGTYHILTTSNTRWNSFTIKT